MDNLKKTLFAKAKEYREKADLYSNSPELQDLYSTRFYSLYEVMVEADLVDEFFRELFADL